MVKPLVRGILLYALRSMFTICGLTFTHMKAFNNTFRTLRALPHSHNAFFLSHS